ncbi:NitT/TauT family transport system ATP-binding protein [Mesorhizobium soli]|jgi:NitT/TauT family transport system ATP-binding protein|uniref:ABC transporter ATP-binding protein n=1 Tax=Pseudaminobacter soli (ex Li et al. 2025) TaxID=1295366 RepID=UPI002475E916|nr:nitrate/sulfonate/bicarbonate ABC transporter ATP-binding protein [Mesorhizobium soli]MDH6231078.1 NitT/TauT family transport system ATP-binding protein [Mesorhizobium soli]
MNEFVTATAANAVPLVEVKSVCQSYDEGQFVVLDDVALTLNAGEIVGLLGRSGSGKSTLLRSIAGLIQPTSGSITFEGKPVVGTPDGISMVFQSFALFPWLTVLQNVELGLEARGIESAERRKRALEAIDLIGLDGFESAYPKELSGGMRQRVGLARALVVHPKVLLMDEPFSALDVLTAETLRTDLLDLWSEGRMPIESILMVTHNIEEAVLMCDRVLIFSSNPGRVAAEIRIDLPQPRDRLDPAFRALVEDIYERMTARKPVAEPAHAGVVEADIDMVLPRVSTNLLSGLIETIAAEPYRGKADLPPLAASLQLEIDDLFPIAESLQLLHFAELAEGDIQLTEAGMRFAEAEVDERKGLFADQLVAHVPLAAHMRRVLDERPSHEAPARRFREELEEHMSEENAEYTLRAITSWARYAELFAYDEKTDMFTLENPS